jgi:hypothetical protein
MNLSTHLSFIIILIEETFSKIVTDKLKTNGYYKTFIKVNWLLFYTQLHIILLKFNCL